MASCGPEPVLLAEPERLADVVVRIGVDAALGQPVGARRAEVGGAGVDRGHGERHLLGDEPDVLELGQRVGGDAQRRVPQRVRALGQERRPRVEVRARRRLAAQADVVVVRVDDGGAGVEAARGVGADLLRGDGHVWIAVLGGAAVDGRLDQYRRFTHVEPSFVRRARTFGARSRATSSISSSVQTARGMCG